MSYGWWQAQALVDLASALPETLMREALAVAFNLPGRERITMWDGFPTPRELAFDGLTPYSSKMLIQELTKE